MPKKENSDVQEVQSSSPEQLVYCGPNWLKHGLTKYQVFQGGKPFNLLEAIKECPHISGLICPVNELDALRKNIETRGSFESGLYEATERFINKSRKGHK